MRRVLLLLMLAGPSVALAQTEDAGRPRRSGFVVGAAFGAGVIGMEGEGVEPGRQAGGSFPNLKFGYMLSERTAVVVLLPGTIYSYRGLNASDRSRHRGFEGIIPSVQQWIGRRWWIGAGAGLALDAPAFYDIKQPEERKFYFGTAAIAATGYEVWQRGRFTWDVQARFHHGRVNLPGGNHRGGSSTNVLIGFNYY